MSLRDPQVLNKSRVGVPPGAVYIGRPTKWGNPFAITPTSTREEVVEKYLWWLLSNPNLIAEARLELAGKDLVCFCAPKLCHGHILIAVSNS